MSVLHPPIESIERAYAAWLRPSERSETPGEQELQGTTWPAEIADSKASLPDHIADAIRRQVESRSAVREPAAGDVVVLAAPDAPGDTGEEPQNPVAVLLDAQTEEGWTGWLVGAHVDYAGDRDLVLDASLIEGDSDPAPLAGMVMCWERVSVRLGDEVPVLHHLTDTALGAARELARAPGDPVVSPAPGRMTVREIADAVVVTGTPYLDDDPRTPYLQLARDLARRVSEPQYDDQGRLRRPDRDGPER
jgi:hypothetical protein